MRISPVLHVKTVFQLKTLTLIRISNLILGSNTLCIHRECEIKMKVCDVLKAEGWFSSAGKKQWLPVLFWMCHRVHLHYVEGLSFVVTLERAPNPLWPINGRAAVWVSTKAFKLSHKHWFDTFGSWLGVCLGSSLTVSICASSGSYVNTTYFLCQTFIEYLNFPTSDDTLSPSDNSRKSTD